MPTRACERVPRSHSWPSHELGTLIPIIGTLIPIIGTLIPIVGTLSLARTPGPSHELDVCAQRLRVLTALLLVRQRRAPAGWAGAVQSHSEVGTALMSLPSGVLALIGEAMTKLESTREARAPQPSTAVPRLASPARTRSLA